MEPRPGLGVVSDIAVHHAETLYGSGTPTLAALSDLAEICQAAVLNESLVAAPAAYHASTLLQQLDCAETLTMTVEESSGEEADPDDAVLIDVSGGRLTSPQPFGRLVLAMMAGELLQESGMFSGLTNPAGLDPDEDRALFFLDRLPIFLFLLQAKKGAAAFDSEAVRRDLLDRSERDRAAYADYAGRLLALHESHGVQPTFSCLEEPLGDDFRVERAIDTIQTPTFWDEFEGKLKDAVEGDRSAFFERWTVPPLGLMVLGAARSLDDLPAQITRLRDRFQKVRRRLVALEQEKQAALNEGGGMDDRRYKDAVSIDQQIRKAFEAFDDALAEHRRALAIKRSERVFNLPKYLGWLVSIGVGSIGHLIEIADLRRRHYLGYVPGLHKSLAFVKSCDAAYIADIAERLLGRPSDSFGLHAAMLQLAAGKIEAYSAYADDAAPVDDDAMTIDEVALPHSEIWWRMVEHDELRRLLLHPLAA
jgi:hypothetical protein